MSTKFQVKVEGKMGFDNPGRTLFNCTDQILASTYDVGMLSTGLNLEISRRRIWQTKKRGEVGLGVNHSLYLLSSRKSFTRESIMNSVRNYSTWEWEILVGSQ